MGLTPNAGTHTSRGNIPPRQELVCFAVWGYVASCMRHAPLSSCMVSFVHAYALALIGSPQPNANAWIYPRLIGSSFFSKTVVTIDERS